MRKFLNTQPGFLEHAPEVTSGLYYKPMTIINDDSRAVNKLESSLTDDTRVVIYDCQMFIVQGKTQLSYQQVRMQ